MLLVVAILFLLLLRNCYHGSYIVNNQPVDQMALGFHASLIAFHVVAAGMFLMTTLLAMGIFSRDREDGSMVLFLARAVDRWQYLLGRIAGTWVLSTLFMFLLHLTIALIGLANTGSMTGGYLTASLMCSVNLLFAIVLTCTCSLFLPNVMAALFSLIIIGVSFVSDGAYQLMHGEALRQVIAGANHTAPWRILYPKVYMLQDLASTSISGRPFEGMTPAYACLNVLFFTAALAAVALWRFHQREI
ncbi:MAG: ABC transporter permease [Desulfatitalea sp.]|nr:ABC transporter permease subunit [Desulfatitalea sp.]NNK02598.1 ABC transporter permease [Desulfatitalea sp.]